MRYEVRKYEKGCRGLRQPCFFDEKATEMCQILKKIIDLARFCRKLVYLCTVIESKYAMIIGRLEEQEELLTAYKSNYSEFVAVYGRRRVGKTFLIREAFDYKFTFSHTGLAKKNTKTQLQNFQSSLRSQGMPKAPLPENWLEAFDMLATLLSQSNDMRKVVFIDEMPWMDAPRSSFLTALEHFWNGWASARKDILLIICGSATSWIINKIIHNHGGLHNRLTYRIQLQPFTLSECEQYAQHLHLEMNRSNYTLL